MSPRRRSIPRASAKIFLLHRLLTEVDAGTRSLEERVTRRPVESIDDSGLWYLLQAAELSLYDVAALIGAVSDNAATNTLGRVIGIPVVQEHTRAPRLQLLRAGRHRAMADPARRSDDAVACERHRTGAVHDASRRRTDLTPASADTLRRWLGAGMDLSMVASAFDLDPLAHWGFDRGIWLLNKTGTISGCAPTRAS